MNDTGRAVARTLAQALLITGWSVAMTMLVHETSTAWRAMGCVAAMVVGAVGWWRWRAAPPVRWVTLAAVAVGVLVAVVVADVGALRTRVAALAAVALAASAAGAVAARESNDAAGAAQRRPWAVGAVVVAGVLSGVVALAHVRASDEAAVVMVVQQVVPREPGQGMHCPDGMVLIPAGEFMMGSPPGVGEENEHPQHRVRVSAFCMDRTEVTVAQFRKYWVDPHRATGPVGTVEYPSGHRMEVTDAPTEPWTVSPCNWSVQHATKEQHPINCIDWATMQAYCVSRGGRLPTEAEWEYAARGTDGREYPWGPQAPGDQLCWSGVTARSGTCEVGVFPMGASPFGLQDMAGNVYEWVADAYRPDAYHHHDAEGFYERDASGTPSSDTARVCRGGGWGRIVPSWVRAGHRGSGTGRSSGLGGRCARGPSLNFPVP